MIRTLSLKISTLRVNLRNVLLRTWFLASLIMYVSVSNFSTLALGNVSWNSSPVVCIKEKKTSFTYLSSLYLSQN